MKLTIIILTQFVLISFNYSQTYNSFIEGLMNQTDLDSLVSFVNILSGEDSVLIGNSNVLIKNRIDYQGNDLAAEYIKQKLKYYGLETYDQQYSDKGRNIYAIQKGALFPQEYFIICAHYDAVANYCADDNASGTAEVLETARILSNHQFNYSIIYALWDEEELGKIGSGFYASQADSNNLEIKGVINFEMSGWDSNNDGLIDIHTNQVANSVSLANTIVVNNSIYNLPLKPHIYNPGTYASDHASFWQFNYTAITISEAYYGGDFNPYYHSDGDRIDKFNLTYFYNIAKLGISSIATLATGNIILSVKEDKIEPSSFHIYNYPNPFNNSTIVGYEIPKDAYITIELYDNIGKKVKNIFYGYKKVGLYESHLNGNEIASGVYYIVLKSSKNILSHKILLMK